MSEQYVVRGGCGLRQLLFCAGVLTLLLFVTQPVCADIYRFVDEEGVVHFSNVPTDPRFRLYIPSRKPSSSSPHQYESIIREVSSRYNMNHHLIRAVIKVESDFNASVVSSKGAQGLMQLMPETASDMQVRNVFNPRENIEGGVKYLRRLLDMFNNNLTLALAAYNAGENMVKQYNFQIPPYKETQDYVRKVLHYFQRYQNGGAILAAQRSG